MWKLSELLKFLVGIVTFFSLVYFNQVEIKFQPYIINFAEFGHMDVGFVNAQYSTQPFSNNNQSFISALQQ